MRQKYRVLSLALGIALAAYFQPAFSLDISPKEEKIVVFAAASMKNALDSANSLWKQREGSDVTVSYAASSTLARQIESGAPADVFISADIDWMDYLLKSNKIKPQSVTQLLGNRLVLIAPQAANLQPTELKSSLDIFRLLLTSHKASNMPAVTPKPGFDISRLLDGKRIAMASPDSVPAGKYGKAAFEKLGLWKDVAPRVAPADNVRAALLLVARGEAVLGVVYQTDATAEKNVSIVSTFPEDSHPAIIYQAGIIASSQHSAAQKYIEFLKSEDVRSRFEAEGFKVLPAKVP
ncbi:molybdate ABC transporter substrate-binding protein [Microvirga sp. W0021]|uniref:Molybdate ABC transporter substrate-binding protein n=1 Tax=Hohaiivirga grylli TaxID=3133970 RepID=A0ABV0BKW4_9HYPH